MAKFLMALSTKERNQVRAWLRNECYLPESLELGLHYWLVDSCDFPAQMMLDESSRAHRLLTEELGTEDEVEA